MEHREGHFDGAGGVRIYWQAWLPDSDPRACIALVHGASEHSGRYEWTAAQLTDAGYAVYALDQRGHGKSGGPRGAHRPHRQRGRRRGNADRGRRR